MADTTISILTGNGLASRARIGVSIQNVGTAVCGLHVGDTPPTSLDECEVILAAGTAADDGLGGYIELSNPRALVYAYFGATGSKKLKISNSL